ncbi:MAG: prolipoprotein diacylglyceryl transferase [Lachnospiraceae bacterium]|nr:prolipoprotein diacylglyceryl transferase [Lachnospiraceae bacterium]
MKFNINTEYNNISPYAIMFLLSFLISFMIAVIMMIRKGVDKKNALFSAMFNFICSLYFAYLFSVVTSGDILKYLKSVSFSSIGGLIGVAVGVIVLSFLFKEYRSPLIKAYALVIPLMYSISKMGCFLVGCCYGIEYDGPFSVTYSGRLAHRPDVELFPVQLTEVLVFFVIFLFGLILEYKIRSKYSVSILVIICALAKASLDFLRSSHVDQIISVNQAACIVIIIISLIVQLCVKRIKKVYM